MSNTDMLTPEQFNEIYNRENEERERRGEKKKKVNCLSYAIGIDEEEVELDYFGGRRIEDSFQSKLENYGLIVKEVNSLDEIKGKTGYILYGFYPIRTLFGFENKDFHVVRVNPDGTCFHKQDMNLPAKRVELLNEKGHIEEYDKVNEPIHFFVLVEERNKNKEKINNRMNEVFSKASDALNSKEINDENRADLQQKLQLLSERLGAQGGTLNSNDTNILLQEVLTLTKEYSLEVEQEGIEPV